MGNTADSDLDLEKARSYEVTKPWNSPDDVPWTLLNPEQLAEAYWDVVAPAMGEDGLDPKSERPTYQWLADNGCRGLTYSLREYHDMSLGDFWEGVLSLEEDDAGYDWRIEHEPTREALKEFINRRRENRSDWTESTADTNRYRLARYTRAYREANGTDDLLTPVDPESEMATYEVNSQCWSAFDFLQSELAETTVYKIYKITDEWYGYMVAMGRAESNPTERLEYEYGWKNRPPEPSSPSSFSAAQVRALVNAAESVKEEMLLIGLCAWGLRSGEVASLHRSQLDFDEDVISFDKRKNGPGTVAMLYGAETAKQRIGDLEDQESDWNMYLFPSNRSESGHVTSMTIARWFHDIADRARVPEVIDGDQRKPHMGRRFWYDRYSATLDDILEFVDEVAEDQGSSSPDVILNNYLSDERKRELRRRFMKERLADAFQNE